MSAVNILFRIAGIAVMLFLTGLDVTIVAKIDKAECSKLLRLSLYGSAIASVVLCIIGVYYCLV